jgi:uncharacterized membrane protein YdbT with pleckstrin-like domain
MKTSKHLSTTSPSQYVNIGWLILSVGLLFVHPITAGLCFLAYIFGVIQVWCWEYRFYEDHVVERKGIFSVTEETVNYFRMKSIRVEQPFWMRLFGMSIIYVTTSEKYKPEIKFYGVENLETYTSFLESKTKLKRKEHNVRDIDIFYS